MDLDWLAGGDDQDCDLLLAQKQRNKLFEQHKKDGFREGYDQGKETKLQEGFNEGFKLAAASAFSLSSLLVLLESLREYEGITEDQKVTANSLHQQIEKEIQRTKKGWEIEDKIVENPPKSDPCACSNTQNAPDKAGGCCSNNSAESSGCCKAQKQCKEAVPACDITALEKEVNALMDTIFPSGCASTVSSTNPFTN